MPLLSHADSKRRSVCTWVKTAASKEMFLTIPKPAAIDRSTAMSNERWLPSVRESLLTVQSQHDGQAAALHLASYKATKKSGLQLAAAITWVPDYGPTTWVVCMGLPPLLRLQLGHKKSPRNAVILIHLCICVFTAFKDSFPYTRAHNFNSLETLVSSKKQHHRYTQLWEKPTLQVNYFTGQDYPKETKASKSIGNPGKL